MAKNDPLSRYVGAALGITEMTRKRAEELVKSVTQQGLQATGNVQELVDGLLERSQENREAIVALVRAETKRIVKTMGLATRTDVERLQRQVANLRRGRAGGEAQGASEAGGRATSAGGEARAAAKATAAEATARRAGASDDEARQAATAAKKTTREAAKRTTKKSAKRAAKKAATKSTGAKRSTKKASKKSAKKATKKATKRSTKRSSS